MILMVLTSGLRGENTKNFKSYDVKESKGLNV